MIGQEIGGRYRIDDQLGQGGMGTVYLGTDTHTGTSVAIKQLKQDIAQPENIERFRREGEALRELNHPNIVKMLDMFEHENQHYLVMEYVSGGDLKSLIENRGKIPYQDCVNMAIDLADALTRAHRLDIIHRDLKPANVLIGDDGVLRLTDFGVAHVGSKERVTDTDAIVGTIDYLPPEAFSGETYDQRGDIWAFGVMLFELLTGERPFSGGTIMEVLSNITTAPIPDLETLCPDAPIALIDLVYRMLERDAQARISSVRHVGATLEDILQGRSKQPIIPSFDTDIPDFSLHPKHNLPAETTSFVGREHELAELDKLLKDSSIRLITIIAQGGMGKTRLSLESAERSIESFADGVYFVELAPLSEANNIPLAVADATGYRLQSDDRDSQQQIIDFLRNKEMLLVFDNYEHLPDGFGLVGSILRSAPKVQILVTSRQRLNQPGETLFHLSGMEFPEWETPEDALEYAAMKLFLNSARRAHPAFELTDDNLDVVARICKLVQGMPLAIVLAASWLAMLTLDEIVQELQQGIDILETDASELPERQRSVRAVMDYSWGQMTEAEQAVFMKLSVFRGGFTREAAQVVASANLRILMSLVNKSLIRRDADTGRYQIHELLRQYGEEHLTSSDDRLQLNERHMSYFAEFMSNYILDIKGRRQIQCLNEIGAEFENIRRAWLYATKQEEFDFLVKMSEVITIYSEIRNNFVEVLELFKPVVTRLSHNANHVDDFTWVRIMACYAKVAVDQHYPPDEYEEVLRECLSKSLSIADQQMVAFCTLHLADFFNSPLRRDPSIALPMLTESLQLYQEIGDEYYIAKSLSRLCYGNYFLGVEHLEQYSQELMNLTENSGNFHGRAEALWYDGIVAIASYDYSNAEQRIIEVLKLRNAMGRDDGSSMAYLSDFAFLKGDFVQAQQRGNKCLKIGQDMRHRWAEAMGRRTLGMLDIIAGNYSIGLQKLEQSVPIILEDRVFGLETMHGASQSSLVLNGDSRRIVIALNAVFNKGFAKDMAIACLPFAAILMARQGKGEHAIEIFSLVHAQIDQSMRGWLDKWSLVYELQDSLKTEIGEDAYNQAWQRGKSLDLETTIQDLIKEFGESD